MPQLEIAKTARPCYTACKRWKKALLRTVLKKMVDLPPPQALLCELEGPSGEVLCYLHPPLGWTHSSPRGAKENQGVTHRNDMVVPHSFVPLLWVPAEDRALCTKTDLSWIFHIPESSKKSLPPLFAFLLFKGSLIKQWTYLSDKSAYQTINIHLVLAILFPLPTQWVNASWAVSLLAGD